MLVQLVGVLAHLLRVKVVQLPEGPSSCDGFASFGGRFKAAAVDKVDTTICMATHDMKCKWSAGTTLPVYGESFSLVDVG